MNEHAVMAIATMLAVGALVIILVHHATTTQQIVGALGATGMGASGVPGITAF